MYVSCHNVSAINLIMETLTIELLIELNLIYSLAIYSPDFYRARNFCTLARPRFER